MKNLCILIAFTTIFFSCLSGGSPGENCGSSCQFNYHNCMLGCNQKDDYSCKNLCRTVMKECMYNCTFYSNRNRDLDRERNMKRDR